MHLILSRHGNTFDPGQLPVWAGSSNDLPLVAKGLEQAQIFAAALKSAGVKPAALYCGPLRRTRDYARIVAETLKLPAPVVDPRLNEIDYGQWSGIGNDEVARRFGADQLAGWNEFSAWPSKGAWGGSEELIAGEVRSFASELTARHKDSDTVVAVSSNGRLRYFLKLIPGEWDRRVSAGEFKVGTGSVCKLVSHAGSFALAYWDAKPGDGTLL